MLMSRVDLEEVKGADACVIGMSSELEDSA